MRTLPPGIEIDPMPDDFAPEFTDDGRVIRWSGMIIGTRYELGLRPLRDSPIARRNAIANLRLSVWQLMELGRLNRRGLMAFAAVDRHRRRPVLGIVDSTAETRGAEHAEHQDDRKAS